MFESMYTFADRYHRRAPPPERPSAEAPKVSGWVGVQGFLAGAVLSILGLAVVALLSSDEKRAARVGWAIGGALTALGLVLLVV